MKQLEYKNINIQSLHMFQAVFGINTNIFYACDTSRRKLFLVIMFKMNKF